jgi:hypothetical protein
MGDLHLRGGVPPCFAKKWLQGTENKGNEGSGERKKQQKSDRPDKCFELAGESIVAVASN